MGFRSPTTGIGQGYSDLLAVAQGVKFQPFSPILADAATAPATQVLRAIAVWATAGSVITGIKMRNSTAAAGTLPTTVRFGLADNTGKILALSANLNALANWGTGPLSFPFTSTFTLQYSGVYLPCFVVNGTWGTTQPTPILEGSAGNSATYVPDGSNAPLVVAIAGQTDLPAVGSSFATTNASTNNYWLALY